MCFYSVVYLIVTVRHNPNIPLYIFENRHFTIKEMQRDFPQVLLFVIYEIVFIKLQYKNICPSWVLRMLVEKHKKTCILVWQFWSAMTEIVMNVLAISWLGMKLRPLIKQPRQNDNPKYGIIPNLWQNQHNSSRLC